jgi:hypothetical protein
MDELSVFMKTEMAAEEIRNRTYKLSQKMRSLLIMTDGKKSVGVLIEMARGLGDVAVMLAELESMGLITRRAVDPRIALAAKELEESIAAEEEKRKKDAVYGDGRGYLNI